MAHRVRTDPAMDPFGYFTLRAARLPLLVSMMDASKTSPMRSGRRIDVKYPA